jgi:hypothetical protein
MTLFTAPFILRLGSRSHGPIGHVHFCTLARGREASSQIPSQQAKWAHPIVPDYQISFLQERFSKGLAPPEGGCIPVHPSVSANLHSLGGLPWGTLVLAIITSAFQWGLCWPSAAGLRVTSVAIPLASILASLPLGSSWQHSMSLFTSGP